MDTFQVVVVRKKKEMELLNKLYYDPSHPASYSGAEKIVNATRGKTTRTNVIDWLKSQDAYNLHRPYRKRFLRAHYNVDNIDDVWEADLVDLQSIKEDNDNYSYLLVVIDVLSKYSWVEPLRSKSATEVKNAFDRILQRSNNRAPVLLQTDKGKEFLGRTFQNFLRSHQITFRVSRDPTVKAAVVERFNRTLKERMWRYFTHQNTHRYIDVLQKFISAYNNARHSSINMSPAEVTLHNAAVAYKNIQRRFSKIKKSVKKLKYKPGDLVRISRAKGAFEKGYEAGWSEELFVIKRAINWRFNSPAVYELRDLAGEEIDGLFYEQELADVTNKDIQNDEFIVEKVIRTRGRGAEKELLVKWTGYPDKFNSWIPATDLKTLK